MDNFLTTKEISKYLKVSIATVQRWRVENIGPAYIKVGNIIRYNVDEVNAWLEQNACNL